MNTTNSGVVKFFIDLNSSLLSIIDALGLGLTALTALGAYFFGKFLTSIPFVTNAIMNLAGAQGVATLATARFASALTGGLVGVAIALVIVGIQKLVNATNDLYDAFEKSKEIADNNQKELTDLASEYEKLANKQNKSADDITRLLDIQTILNTKYGALKDGINTYSDAISGNSKAIQENIAWIKKQSEEQAKNFLEINKLKYQDAQKYLNTPESNYGILANRVTVATPQERLATLDSEIAKNGDILGLKRSQRDSLAEQIDIYQKIIIEYEHYQNISSQSTTSDMRKEAIDDLGIVSKKTTEVVKSLADLQKAFDDLFGSLQSMNDQADTLIESYKQYGQLSIDQVNQLKKMYGEEYVLLLTVENGQIKLNVEALKQLNIQKAMDAVVTAKQISAAGGYTDLLEQQVKIAEAYYYQLSHGTELATNAIKDQEKAYQDILKITIDMIKQEKNAEKDRLQQSLSDYKDMIDAKKKALEDQSSAEKEALQDQLDGYKKIIDAAKELIDQKNNEAEYQDKVATKNKEISDIDSQLLALSFDNSEAAKAKRLQLEADKTAKLKELGKIQGDYATTNAKDALDKEFKSFEEQNKKKQDLVDKNLKYNKDALDAQYKYFEDDIKKRIKDIDDYLKQTNTITQDAMIMLQDKNHTFIQELISWNEMFGDSIQKDVIDKWKLAFEWMSKIKDDPNAQFEKQHFYSQRGNDLFHNNVTGKEIDKSTYDALPYHSGGIAGGKALDPSTEVYAKLLRGESIETPDQIKNFLNKTLPNIVANVNGGGNTTIDMPITINGNVDKSILPDFKNAVLEAVNTALKSRGNQRGAFQFSV